MVGGLFPQNGMEYGGELAFAALFTSYRPIGKLVPLCTLCTAGGSKSGVQPPPKKRKTAPVPDAVLHAI
jgi:hypothetical protein